MLKFNKWNIHVSSFIPHKIKLCNRKCVILIWSEKKSQTRLNLWLYVTCVWRLTHLYHLNYQQNTITYSILISNMSVQVWINFCLKKQRPWKAQCIEWLYLLTNPCNFLSEIYWRKFLFTLRSNLVLKNKFGMIYP